MADATYLDMQNRIIADMKRSGLATVVPAKIQEAIRRFKNEGFYPGEGSFTPIASVADQRAYDFPEDFSQLIGPIFVTNSGGAKVPMESRSITYLDTLDGQTVSPLLGPPSCYSLFGTQFVVGPRPDTDDYIFDARYRKTLAAPTIGTSTGFWMNEAQDLIAHYAMGLIWQTIIRNPEFASHEFELANQFLMDLITQSDARSYSTGVEAIDYDDE